MTILDLRTTIEPAWCTPAVRSLAQVAAGGDTEAFAVLADALEEAGAAPQILRHLRLHDHALTRCWVVDALVVGPSSRS